jgi:hypothetical protein
VTWVVPYAAQGTTHIETHDMLPHQCVHRTQ